MPRNRYAVSRRDFLRGLGVGAAAPFIPVLDQHAEAAGFPRRLVLISSPIGMVTAKDERGQASEPFWPSGGEDFFFPSGTILEPLSPHRSSLVIPKGIRRLVNPNGIDPGAGHEALGVLFTGAELKSSDGSPTTIFNQLASDASIDQKIASALPQETAIPTLDLGVRWDINDNKPTPACLYSLYDGPFRPRPLEKSPYKTFDKLAGPGGLEAAALERIRVSRRSVLDLHRAELSTLMGKIDRTDRAKIDAHLSAVSALEKQLQPNSQTMAGCTLTPLGGKLAYNTNDNFPAMVKLQMDLIVQALSCDRTRIATLQLSNAFSDVRHNWVGVSDGHHSASHNQAKAGRDDEIKICRWYTQQLAYFLGEMKKRQEGAGTLLDNTLVVFTTEMSSANLHMGGDPAPVVLAGGLGGRLQTGRYLDYNNSVHWNQFLTSICQAMGANITEVGNLGPAYQAHYGMNPAGTIPGLFV